MSDFPKYVERGAYHWRLVYPNNIVGYEPRLSAHYEIPVQYVKRHHARPMPIGIDIGTGDGLLLHKACQHHLKIIGMDLSPIGLQLARQELIARQGSTPPMLCASAYAIPLPSASIDFATSVEVIEHLESASAFLTEMRRLLRSGGIFVCTTPRRIFDNGEVQDQFHFKEYSSEELYQELSVYFDDVEVKGLHPQWLDRLYRHNKGNAFPNLLVRRGFQLLSRLHNPYTSFLHTHAERWHCQTLVGIGFVR